MLLESNSTFCTINEWMGILNKNWAQFRYGSFIQNKKYFYWWILAFKCFTKKNPYANSRSYYEILYNFSVIENCIKILKYHTYMRYTS